jgi:ABC-2 type transport system permease protein
MMFLLTPIFWHADQLPGRALLVVLNPFYYFVEVIRQPLLGEVPPASIWITALAITLVDLLVAIPFYSRFRNRVAYWV